MTPIVALSFTTTNFKDEQTLKSKLGTVAEYLQNRFPDGYTVKSCHMTEELCEETGIDTYVPTALKTVFGNKYECMVTAHTLDDLKENLNKYRAKLADEADILIVIDADITQQFGNVVHEIALFTNNKVIML